MLKEILETIEGHNEENNATKLLGNRSLADKRTAKIRVAMMKKAKCHGNMTPARVPGPRVRYICTLKDQEKSREVSRARKIFNKTPAAKRANISAVNTKKFRKDKH